MMGFAVLCPLLGVSAGVLGGLRKKLDILNVESDPLRQALLEVPPYLVRIAVELGQEVFPRNEQSQMLDRGTVSTVTIQFRVQMPLAGTYIGIPSSLNAAKSV